MWWTGGAQNASNTPITVVYGETSLTNAYDQRVATNEWSHLGVFGLGGPTNSYVYMQNAADGRIVADAVKFVSRTMVLPEVGDNDFPNGFTASGNWFKSRQAGKFYGSTYSARATASVSDPAVWSLGVYQTGQYRVEARWSAGSNRATAAPYIISHAGGTTTVTANQRQNDGAWVTLGTYNFNQGTATVSLSCWTNSGQYVIADAVRLVRVQ